MESGYSYSVILLLLLRTKPICKVDDSFFSFVVVVVSCYFGLIFYFILYYIFSLVCSSIGVQEVSFSLSLSNFGVFALSLFLYFYTENKNRFSFTLFFGVFVLFRCCSHRLSLSRYVYLLSKSWFFFHFFLY